MRWGHVKAKLLNQSSQPWRLTFRKVEHEPCERRGVDDRMLERALEATTDQPGVERIVAVLDENGALCESQERPPRISELGGADEHRAIDVVTLFRVRVDRRATIHQRVEKSKRAV
jgi:hypothetical protein